MSTVAGSPFAAPEVEPGLDVKALGRWLDTTELPGTGAAIETRYLSGGSQNLIFEVRRGGLHGALRVPPASAPPGRDDGIRREHRILAALAGSDVPHPPALAMCDDPSVLGRPWYLMGFVDGWSPMGHTARWPAPFDADLDARRGLSFALVDGVARMAAFDWRAAGLEDLGRPDGFHDRQVDRWTAFLDRVRARDLPGLDVATRWLRAHRPIDFVPGLMHGDYQFANVMYRHGAPAELAAIVDWEMGTIGDPKLDLAWVLQGWPADTDAPASGSYVDLTGMPSTTELLEHFVERSGRQVDDIDYYLVLARWKLAIVLEAGFQRAGDDPKLAAFGDVVLDLIARAADLAESTDYSVAP